MNGQSQISLYECTIDLPDAEATAQLGAHLARLLEPGDCLLLSGPIGAGKSHLARSAIRCLMEENGEAAEDIPSPTYTLVQTYPAGDTELWHADLYRLADPSEVMELGLDEGFETGICFVEWPDRLGPDAPGDALDIELSEQGQGRRVVLRGPALRWKDRLMRVEKAVKGPDDTTG
ncbi:tRNA (adenosine(37)-N6)-threonylcarbamoyltransferase complex ATPase subunit type 1 TsaE [Aliiruegeria sabulilitoris]|uniref:tRNA (adenosine(37)-N6)-threonylcarbamoyltransferase complex ATPase subunit type 1 TsaE n=1 Tax=Aliiruegeria sabulilitoris TaxID=1510458 RepID=UPI000831D5B2|nr:tRNA (adenosine(37)-N6)-threonylcarbamoyltransferase complex ATPase subunit type 1 TsaE [Aliiruegeria sabulilitoris]NDR57554.1 tRNA (adenosine(37)-N6)-threonylcarbamoyltransferase complex ATPase subunit type 1 TsaE [Pseudoruegeria sp. M32A2M]